MELTRVKNLIALLIGLNLNALILQRVVLISRENSGKSTNLNLYRNTNHNVEQKDIKQTV